MVMTQKYFINRILCVKWVHHYNVASSDTAEIEGIIQVWRAAANAVIR